MRVHGSAVRPPWQHVRALCAPSCGSSVTERISYAIHTHVSHTTLAVSRVAISPHLMIFLAFGKRSLKCALCRSSDASHGIHTGSMALPQFTLQNVTCVRKGARSPFEPAGRSPTAASATPSPVKTAAEDSQSFAETGALCAVMPCTLADCCSAVSIALHPLDKCCLRTGKYFRHCGCKYE
jgi:hypothetical protein